MIEERETVYESYRERNGSDNRYCEIKILLNDKKKYYSKLVMNGDIIIIIIITTIIIDFLRDNATLTL